MDATWLRSGEATVRSCSRGRTRRCQEDEVTLNSTVTEFDTSLTSRRITFYVKNKLFIKERKLSWTVHVYLSEFKLWRSQK